MIRRFLPPSHSLLPHTKRSFFFTGGGMGTEVELACQSSENYRNFILCRITKASKWRSTTPQTPRTNSPHWQDFGEACKRSAARWSSRCRSDWRLVSSCSRWWMMRRWWWRRRRWWWWCCCWRWWFQGWRPRRSPRVFEGSHRGVSSIAHRRQGVRRPRQGWTGTRTPPARTGWTPPWICPRSCSQAWGWAFSQPWACEGGGQWARECQPSPTWQHSPPRPEARSPSDPSTRPSNDWSLPASSSPASVSSPFCIDKSSTRAPRTPYHRQACSWCAVPSFFFLLIRLFLLTFHLSQTKPVFQCKERVRNVPIRNDDNNSDDDNSKKRVGYAL